MLRTPRLTLELAVTLLAGPLLAAPPGARPSRDEVVYRVVDVHPASWIVTAQDLATGHQVRFKLNPRAFERKQFRADLAGRRVGQRFSVVAPPDEPLGACCEVTAGGAPGAPPGPAPGPAPRTAPEPPRRPAPPRVGSSGGGGEPWEIVSVDPRRWIVTVRGSAGGGTVSFKVDPESFVGYEFKADLRAVRQGHGFSLIGINERPLADCCTVVSTGGSR